MKITGIQVQSLLKIYGKSGRSQKPSEGVGSVKTTDNIVISGEGKLKHRAVQAAIQSEDVRRDKVDQIKQAMASGTYKVTPDEVAEQMIYRSIVDKLI